MSSSSYASLALQSTADLLTSSVDADVMPTFQLQTTLTAEQQQQGTSGARAHLTGTEEDVFQGVHTTLTVLALSANCLSLLVIYGVVTQLTPPLRVLTSLSFAQMLAPWAVMTIYFSRSPCQDEIHTSVLLTSHNAEALTLFVLALTHNVATFRPFQYTSIASPRRLWTAVAVIWVAALTLGHVHFLVSLGGDRDGDRPGEEGYCARVADHVGIALAVCLVLALLVILTGVVIYRRILASLRPVEAFVVKARVNRCPNGVATGIALVTGYAVGWVPYLVVRSVVAYRRSGESRATLLTTGISQAVIVVVCFLDPVIYGLRMEKLRNGYGKLAQRVRSQAAGALVWCRGRLRWLDDDDIPNTPLNPIDAISY